MTDKTAISEAVQEALAAHQRKVEARAENIRRADEWARRLLVGGTIRRKP